MQVCNGWWDGQISILLITPDLLPFPCQHSAEAVVANIESSLAGTLAALEGTCLARAARQV